jgi:hypothetical protein
MSTVIELPTVEFDANRHEYRVDGELWPNVTGILSAVGLATDWSQKPPDVRAAAEAKKALGRRVHDACALLDGGALSWGALDDDVFPYVEAWERYTRQRGIRQWLAIEKPLGHPLYRFAGTLDRLALAADRFTLTDIKCGDPDDAGGAFQTAGYALLIDAHREALGLPSTLPLHRLERECVQLFPTGLYTLEPYPNRDDWKVFVAALTVFTHQPRRRTR